jgi:hypothetical protein
MDEKKTNSETKRPKEGWHAPALEVHGDFHELTQFSSGPGGDDGFYDPGVGTSAA